MSKLRQSRSRRAVFLTSVALIGMTISEQALAACDTTTPCITGPTGIGGFLGQFISQDGSVVAGPVTVASDTSFVWSNGVFTNIGTLYGRATAINAMSSDGRTVVGASGFSNSQDRAFRWTAGTGIVELALLPSGNASTARGVNADGSVIVGYSNRPGNISAAHKGRLSPLFYIQAER